MQALSPMHSAVTIAPSIDAPAQQSRRNILILAILFVCAETSLLLIGINAGRPDACLCSRQG